MKIPEPYKQRLLRLLSQLRAGIYEKETETALALLAALAGESVLLLGPPGVAKSMVARRLKAAFAGATSFEYLMSRFSTPDEIFGPVSIARLKEDDSYERAVEGYLPTAEVVFLDEIWKAGPAIQNTLLTVMNEKLFRNGNVEMVLPLKLLVAASNELPAKGEGLEALWDRFLVRIVSRCIGSEDVFRRMLLEAGGGEEVEVEGALTADDCEAFARQAAGVVLGGDLLDAIGAVRRALGRVEVEGSDLVRAVYVSDRRWMHIARLLRAEACALDLREAGADLLLPLRHCLWNEPEEIEAVRRIVLAAVFGSVSESLARLSAAVKSDLRARRAKEALAKARREGDRRDERLEVVDRFFYQVENHGTGHTCVFITDFKRMPVCSVKNAPAPGVMYDDPACPLRRIVRLFDPDGRFAEAPGCERVTLARDDSHIYINGVAFKMREQGRVTLNPAAGAIGGLLSAPPAASGFRGSYEEEAEAVCSAIDGLMARLRGNIFVGADDLQEAERVSLELMKRVALVRVDIRKLLYDEE